MDSPTEGRAPGWQYWYGPKTIVWRAWGVALSDCMQDVNLRMWIAEEVGIVIHWPVDIHVDNKAAVHFQKNMSPDSRLKGIFDMRQGWMQELHDRDKYKTVKIHTSKNLADELTKPLPPADRKSLQVEQDRIQLEVLHEFIGSGGN